MTSISSKNVSKGKAEDPDGYFQRCRRRVFTLNNPTQEELDGFEEAKSNPCVKVLVGQPEIAPTTGTPHIQGYLHTIHAKTGPATQKELPFLRRAKLIKANGTEEECIRYCTKQETRVPGTEPSVTIKKESKEETDDKISVSSLSPDQRLDFNISKFFLGYWQSDATYLEEKKRILQEVYESDWEKEYNHVVFIRKQEQKALGCLFPVNISYIKAWLSAHNLLEEFARPGFYYYDLSKHV